MNAPIMNQYEARLLMRIEIMEQALQKIAHTDLHATDHRDFERRAKIVALKALGGSIE